MAFLQSDHVFHNSLRPPAREAHDSQSCAITRGSVPNDMVAFRSQHSSAGPGIFEQQFATTKYPATKVKLTPRDGVTPAWNEEFKNLISQCRRSHILIEDGPPTLHRFLQEAPSSTYNCCGTCKLRQCRSGNGRTQTCFISYVTLSTWRVRTTKLT